MFNGFQRTEKVCRTKKKNWQQFRCEFNQREAWISHGWKPVSAIECSTGGWDSINVRYAECYGDKSLEWQQ